MRVLEIKQKEKAIFDGIFALIKRGTNPYTIKVSDITTEAGVGKGTLYEYFKTKEEAISKAILHHIGLGLQQALLAVKSQDSFQSKFEAILLILARQARENKDQCRLFSPMGDLQTFYQYLTTFEDYLQANNRWIKQIYDDIFQAGEREGLIQPLDPQDDYYREMALLGAMAAFAHSLYRPLASLPLETAMEAAYRLLVKALS
jgi:AcrR family transcriptional regulator